MSDAVAFRVGLLAYEVIHPGEPLAGNERLGGLGPEPSAGGSDGDGVSGEAFFAPIAVAGRGDRDALFERVKVGLFAEVGDEGFTAGFQEFDVAFTVRFHIALEIENVVTCLQGGVPAVEIVPFGGGHAIGVVIVCGG